jgi:phosphate transport system permease protein
MEGPPKVARQRPRRQTRASVKIKDAVAWAVITVGGVATIAAVLGVAVFLLWVVWPLFVPPRAEGTRLMTVKWPQAPPTRIAVDESRIIGWTIEAGGELKVFRMSDGRLLSSRALSVEPPVTAWTNESPGSDEFAIGLADGTVRLGHVRFVSEVRSDRQARQALEGHRAAEPPTPYLGGLAEAVDADHVRLYSVEVQLEQAMETGSRSPIRLLDHVASRSRLAVVHEDGRATVFNLDTARRGDGTIRDARRLDVDYQSVSRGAPRFILLSGDYLLLAWQDGTLARYDVGGAEAKLIETSDLVPAPTASLTALAVLAGRGTLITGDSHGAVKVWFLTRSEQLDSLDKLRMTLARQLLKRTEPVTALAASARTRIVAAGYADGHVELAQATTGQRLLDVPVEEESPITGLALAPREDALFTASRNGIALSRLNLGHAEASLASLFLPVWYQDYEGPAHVWQSTGGSAANEPKFGVMPLVFGTIKATFYSLLFAVPIALLAAVYTSEFLARQARARIKPTIELMASLPSVVLGYLAAFVVAPRVARCVPAVLVAFALVPATFLFAAYLLQLLPERLGIRLKYHRFVLVLLVLPLGIAWAWSLGPLVENWLFGGDLIRWLSSHDGSAVGGWMLLLLPLSAVTTAYFVARVVTPWLRRVSSNWTSAQCAIADLAKFLSATGIALAAAWIGSYLLAVLGCDPRGPYLGTYIQRNAMIVGFAMGFAIIPVIYTIAEDALSSVPEHLRSASLGAGATPWQTTMRIIIPTAMSGLFSAVMIGLGRAVGETMIVLMAAGNTPIMEWNIFNGFRTLSANLAVELPEAEQGSTHFRVLFLTAFALFTMTFVINTIAEGVRQRFRRRAYQL